MSAIDLPESVCSLSSDEKRKLLKQATDSGLILFFKQFVPFYWFRYWNTRLKVGSVVCVFFLLFASATANVVSLESKLECSPVSGSCDQTSSIFSGFDLVFNTSAPIVFAIYSGFLARKARERLGVDRKTAQKLLAE
jgi:hypothetical protein